MELKLKQTNINNYQELWHNIFCDIKESFDENTYNQWLSKIKLHSCNEHELIICSPSKFLRDWIRREYLEKKLSKTKTRFIECGKPGASGDGEIGAANDEVGTANTTGDAAAAGSGGAAETEGE